MNDKVSLKVIEIVLVDATEQPVERPQKELIISNLIPRMHSIKMKYNQGKCALMSKKGTTKEQTKSITIRTI
jgi:hypothetical protein